MRLRAGLKTRLNTFAGREVFFGHGTDGQIHIAPLEAGQEVSIPGDSGALWVTRAYVGLPDSAVDPAEDNRLVPLGSENAPLAGRLEGLKPALSEIKEAGFEVLFLMNQTSDYVQKYLDADNFNLFCVPVINLFEKQLDRINLGYNKHEYIYNTH